MAVLVVVEVALHLLAQDADSIVVLPCKNIFFVSFCSLKTAKSEARNLNFEFVKKQTIVLLFSTA